MSLLETCSRIGLLSCSIAVAAVGVFPAGVADAQTIVLHSFAGGATDGAGPQGSALMQAADGNFYGIAAAGGPHDDGTVFRMTPAGSVTVLHFFNGSQDGIDGRFPRGGLLQARDGNLYGTTLQGGENSGGTIFKVAPAGTVALVHPFTFSNPASPVYAYYPAAPLIQANDGIFYGTTSGGGASAAGAIVLMTPGGFVGVMHSFDPALEGSQPLAPLLQATDGNFYGTTSSGGLSGRGTVFRMTPAGKVTILHAFAGGATDGSRSFGGLVQATDGNFYGTTYEGGPANRGTVFKMTPAGTVSILHAFAGPDGNNPNGTLLLGRDGGLYGTTLNGGVSNQGIVYKLTLSGTLSVLHSFAGGPADGRGPGGALVQGTDGNLYGMTYAGGASDLGTIFRTASKPNPNPLHTAAVLHDLDGDGRTDLAIWRPSTGTWYRRGSADAYASSASTQWGVPGDIPVSGDFDGDGRMDLTVWRPSNGTWYTLYSSYGYSLANVGVVHWGQSGDLPMSADFDGDGITDLVFWRPANGTWYVLYSSLGYSALGQGVFQWGLPNDVPISADFDGDGRTDLSVWRPSTGTWYVLESSLGFKTFQWGLPADLPLSTDFDGDGKTDLVVWRPSTGTWYIRYSSLAYSLNGAAAFQWGLQGDVPLSSDFDGDGKADLVVYRPAISAWFIRYSSLGYDVANAAFYQLGQPGDTIVR